MNDTQTRKSVYNNFVSDIAKQLLDEIYNNEEGFVKQEYVETSEESSGVTFVRTVGVHPLEEYIISYDENMEHEGIIISIGERIGFNLDYDDTGAYPPAVQFYDRCSYTIRNNVSPRISKIMNMTKDEFKLILKSKGYTYTDEIYNDRLNIDSNGYPQKMMEMYYALENPKYIGIPEDELDYYEEGVVSNVDKIKIETEEFGKPGELGGDDGTEGQEENEDDINVKEYPIQKYAEELLDEDDDDDNIEFERLEQDDE
jgi:hypothetical protein